MPLKELTPDTMEAYRKLVGDGRFALTMKVLSEKYKWLHQVLETEIGMAIMEEDMGRHDELLFKLYNDDIDMDEKAELNYLKRRLALIGNKIVDYKQKEMNVTKQIAKGGK